MAFGALAVIDALGFKGIWKRAEHAPVISKLRALVGATGASLDQSFGGEDYRATLAKQTGNLLT